MFPGHTRTWAIAKHAAQYPIPRPIAQGAPASPSPRLRSCKAQLLHVADLGAAELRQIRLWNSPPKRQTLHLQANDMQPLLLPPVGTRRSSAWLPVPGRAFADDRRSADTETDALS